MFNKKRQARVEISFMHGSHGETIPKEVIEVPIGQYFEHDIGGDILWEGKTLVKEFDWVAGYTRVYEYFYV
jgi:hypothetical protein